MKPEYDIKLMELICGDYKKTGYCFVDESLEYDILVAFKAGKALSETKLIKKQSYWFDSLKTLRRVKDFFSGIPFKRLTDESCANCDEDEKCDVNKSLEYDSRKTKNSRKDIKKKMLEKEREDITSEYNGILDISIVNVSSKNVIVEVKCVDSCTVIDYSWFKLTAKYFYQRQSLKNYEL